MAGERSQISAGARGDDECLGGAADHVGSHEAGARQLERGNSVVPLEPKMYELLEVLIKRRPAVVTNNELDELLWPNVYVARTSLTRLVSELRAVLGDSPRDSSGAGPRAETHG